MKQENKTFLDRFLFKPLGFFTQLLLLSAVIAGFFQVISRFILQSPADWTESWTRYSLIWVVFMGTIIAFREGAMLKVEVLNSILSDKKRRIVEHLVNLVSCSFLGFLGWIGIQMTYRTRFQRIPSLDIPISYIYIAIPIACGLGILAIIVHWFNPKNQADQFDV